MSERTVKWNREQTEYLYAKLGRQPMSEPMTPEILDGFRAMSEAGLGTYQFGALIDEIDRFRVQLAAAEDKAKRLEQERDRLYKSLIGMTCGDGIDAERFQSVPEMSVALAMRTKRESEQSVAELVAGLEPFAEFARQWDRKTPYGIGDIVYSIHEGTDWEAFVRISDMRRAAALLQRFAGTVAKHQPASEERA